MSRTWGPDPEPRPTPGAPAADDHDDPAPDGAGASLLWRWFTPTVRVPRAEVDDAVVELAAVAERMRERHPDDAARLAAVAAGLMRWSR